MRPCARNQGGQLVSVAYCGNFMQPHCTEVHVARSLEAVGARVIRLQENMTAPGQILSVVRAHRPDLFLFTRTWGGTVTVELLRELRSLGVPSVSYHLDLYVGLERGGPADPKSWHNIGSDPFWLTDWVFSADGDPASQEFFESKGIRHRWLPPGVVADECYLADVPLERDVVFVGSRRYHPEWPYRPQLIDWLERTYRDRFTWLGCPGEPVRGDALNRLYASTRVVVGDSCNPGYRHSRYWSDRIPETLGRGGFLIHPRVEGMAEQGFVDGETLATYEYGDLDGLKELIDHYLVVSEEREDIRRAGHKLVSGRHTYTHRVTEMLDVLKRENAL